MPRSSQLRLPIFMELAPGESLPSYLERVAAAVEWPLGRVLVATGLLAGGEAKVSLGFGVWLDENRRGLLAAATDVDEVAIAGCLLDALGGIAFELDPALRRVPYRVFSTLVRQWAMPGGSFFCPECLAEDGYWRLRWRVGWGGVCVRHARVLAYRCPACASPAGESRFNGSKLGPLFDEPPVPGVCGSRLRRNGRLRGVRCGHALDVVESASLGVGDPALAAQQELDVALSGEAVRVGERRLLPLEFFGELRALASLVLFAGSPPRMVPAEAPALRRAFEEHVERRPTKPLAPGRARRQAGTHVRVPSDPALVAAVVPTALELLRADDAELRDRLVPLVVSAEARSRPFAAVLADAFDFGPRLLRAWTDAQEAYNRSQGRGRATPGELGRAGLVPQLFWRELYGPLGELMPAVDETLGRCYASLLLVRSMCGVGWNEAALTLGLADVRGDDVAAALETTVDQDVLGGVQNVIAAVADALLAAPDPIDYGARRRELSRFDEFRWADWQLLAARAGVAVGAPGLRNRMAAAWLWGELTGGDPHLSPAFRLGVSGEDYTEFVRLLIPALEEELRVWAGQLVFGSGLLGDEGWLTQAHAAATAVVVQAGIAR